MTSYIDHMIDDEIQAMDEMNDVTLFEEGE